MRIAGGACVLRDWVRADVEPLRHWLAPDAGWRATNGPYFGPPDPASIDRTIAAVSEEIAAVELTTTPRRWLAIAAVDDDRLLGRVEWYWESEVTDWRRIGIAVYDPACRGRGVGREALSLWTEYLFTTTDALRLDLVTYSGNVAMCRAAEAAGFVLEGRMRQARRWAGGVHDSMVFGVLRDEWRSTP